MFILALLVKKIILIIKINKLNQINQASFYSTLAMTLYSVTSFFLSPIAATLSDTLGRKPIFMLAALTDSITGILLGLLPSNWVKYLLLRHKSFVSMHIEHVLTSILVETTNIHIYIFVPTRQLLQTHQN
jgi:MFS family permease